MFELVNPCHPDKVADRIAGAIVDLAYTKQVNPKVAVEVLLGHGTCHIINETSCHLTRKEIKSIIDRIVYEPVKVDYKEVAQDAHLAKNQEKASEWHCGDNGIFRGIPTTDEMKKLFRVAKGLYNIFESDGKYIIDKEKLIICQSNDKFDLIKKSYPKAKVNPLGFWTGGSNVDSGATNRKLGSDMGAAVTGGGLHGKDLSKADVSVNIYCHILAQKVGEPIEARCAIGDKWVLVNGQNVSFEYIVSVARDYIHKRGGFEKFAEWGFNGEKEEQPDKPLTPEQVEELTKRPVDVIPTQVIYGPSFEFKIKEEDKGIWRRIKRK